MAQMILSTKQKQITGQGEQTCGCQRGRGDGVGFQGWWIQTVTFGIDGQQGPTLHCRRPCVIESLCCTTEIEETL